MGKNLLIEARNLTKSFPGVLALDDVSLQLFDGEVHCLVGENGAGKSTFIKVLTGVVEPDHGKILTGGSEYTHLVPALAQSLGIHAIYQENILIPQLSVAENVFVGHEPLKAWGIVDRRKTLRDAQELIDSLDIDLDPSRRVETLSIADQQFVKILKSLSLEPRIMIMDEPTTVFNAKDAERVLQLVRDISHKGIGVIYISHNLKEVSRIADRISVLRDGKLVNTHDRAVEEIELSSITKEMVGRPVDLFYSRDRTEIGNTVLKVENMLLHEKAKPIGFAVRSGEILGIAGMVGAGRTEIFEALFGSRPAFGGTIQIGDAIHRLPRSPEEAIRLGLGMVTEDRQRSGLAMGLSVTKNMTIVALGDLQRFFLDIGKERRVVEAEVEKLGIRTPSVEKEVQFLSGGNQQKTVLAKWLLKGSKVLIVDEPTQGVDVNAKTEIYSLLTSLAREGKAIIIISSDMPELVSLSDRVLVVRNGEVVDELAGTDITEEKILHSAIEVV